ncbi:head-tail connector protein [Shimia abyssi]|nr:head-tail connector protein [Shimia abyssi]
MMLVEETSVSPSALPVDEFKAHLRMGSGFADESLQDSVLESFLLAAMSATEARTGKVLIERCFACSLAGWRGGAAQGLPVAPVNAVTSVTLSDSEGGTVTVSPSAYYLVADAQRPVLKSKGSCLPAVPTDGSVTVRFVGGYGASWSDVPSDLQQAVLLLAAHYYECRHETSLKSGCMPFGVTSLLERYRPVRLHMGGGV